MAVNFNRMKNMFTPGQQGLFAPNNQDFQQAIAPAPQPIIQEEPQYEEPAFTNRSLDQFAALQAPERGQLGKRGTVSQFLMNLGGIDPDKQDKILQSKYHSAYNDYKDKADYLLKGAAIEGQQNQYKSLADYRNGQLAVANRRAGTGEVNATTGQTRANISQQSLDLRNRLALLPKTKLRLGRGGQPDLLIDEFGKTIASYPSGTTDAETLEKLRQTGRVELANINNEADAAMNDADNTTSRGNALISATTRIATDNGPSSNPESATQEIARRKLRAQQLIGMHPDWEKYIDFDENLGPRAKPGSNFAGMNFGGAPKEIAKQIQDFIDGNGPMAVPGMPPADPAMKPSAAPVNNTPVYRDPPPPPAASSNYSQQYGPTVNLGRPAGDNMVGAQPQGQVLQKQQRKGNQVRTVYSTDGGKTWSPR